MGGGGGGQTSQVQKADPWEGQKPYLTQGYEWTKAAAEATPTTPYSGALSTPVTEQQKQVNQGVTQSGQALSSFAPTALTAGQGILQNNPGVRVPGVDVSPYAPYTQQMVSAATNPIFERYQQQIMPGIGSDAMKAGAYVGTDIGKAQNLAGNNLIREATDASAKATLPIWQTVMNRQNAIDQMNMGANVSEMNLVPQLTNAASTATVQGGTMATQGAQQVRDWNLEPVQEAIQRYQMALQAPWQAVNPYMQNIQGFNPGGTTTATGTSKANSDPMAAIAPIGSMALMAAMMMMSDERLKENIEEVGEVGDYPLYRFNYKGDDRQFVGVMAQDVEKVDPEAVHEVGGYKAVDYGRVLESLA